MKRSEMVINLSIHLMSRLPEWMKESRREFASELLSDLEIDGMIPPMVGIGEEDDWGFLDYEFKWEKEDET